MIKIIFVDDSKLVLKSIENTMKEYIEQKIIECEFYNDPVSFFEIIKNNKIDFNILFTDINMPKMDGYELTKRIKNIKEYRPKPIIAMTTEISIEAKIKGKAAGMNGWITKMASPEVMKVSIKKYIDGYKR